MCVSNVRFSGVLKALIISGGSLGPLALQAADTLSVTMSGMIQAPAADHVVMKTAGAQGHHQGTADTIPVTLTGVIQAPAANDANATAGVVIGGTRMIYEGNEKESTIVVRNQGKQRWLVRSWVEKEDSLANTKERLRAPFDVSPAPFRLEPGASETLHVTPAGGRFPADRETVYWLNIKMTPDAPKPDKNTLMMSVNQRLKLFYRPAGMTSPGEADYKKLMFRKEKGNILVTNPTPYYVTLHSLSVGGKDILTQGKMVPPKGEMRYPFADHPTDLSRGVIWDVITDQGTESQVIQSVLN